MPLPFPQFKINDRDYRPDESYFDVKAGTVEEWVIGSPSASTHPFHLHVNPFQVKEVYSATTVRDDLVPEIDRPLAAARIKAMYHLDHPNMWRDSIIIPPKGMLRVWIGFSEKLVRKTVFHGHFLAHEETGMIQNFTIVPCPREGAVMSVERVNRRSKALIMVLGLAIAGLMAAPAHAERLANCRPISAADGATIRNRTAVATDIDGVLTQYVLQDYGPTDGAFVDRGIAYPRTDSALLMNIYHRLGYLIVYMAFRPRNLEVMGRSMCDATLAWLHGHGFPTEKGDTLLLLADAPDSVTKAVNKGDAMASYAGEQGTALFIDMLEAVRNQYGIHPQYGYVDSDVVTDAFLKVGIPAGHIFTIGNKGMSALGYKGTQPIMGPEPNPGYTGHIEGFVIPNVPVVSR